MGVKLIVATNDVHPFQEFLGDDQPVKWVALVMRPSLFFLGRTDKLRLSIVFHGKHITGL